VNRNFNVTKRIKTPRGFRYYLVVLFGGVKHRQGNAHVRCRSSWLGASGLILNFCFPINKNLDQFVRAVCNR